MLRFAPIRLAVVAALALPASAPAQPPQTTRPATAAQPANVAQPTNPAQPTPQPIEPAIPLTPSQLPPNRAQVTYNAGILSVSADNASLNQILRQIATDTGIKITGGVRDERVFGQYGPAAPDQILSALLDGTGSNMVLVHRESPQQTELILTPRQGGPTPPNPNAAAFNDRDDDEPEPPQRPRAAEPAVAPAPVNSTSMPVTPASPATTSGSSQPESPNGVKTPQEIYEQLQRMRQQQQHPQTPPQTPPQ